MIEQANFTYSPLGKALEKQRKTIEDQEIRQVEFLKDLKPAEELEPIKGLFQKNMKTDEIKTKYMKSKNGEKKLNEKL